MFTDALYECIDACSNKACRKIYGRSMGMFQAIHFLASSAIEVYMIFGMSFVGAIVFANGETGNTIISYDLVYYP